MSIYLEIIKEICKKHEINLQVLSQNWVCKLQKENITKFIVGYQFDLNSQGTSALCNDKYALYEVLKQVRIPVIEHQLIFRNEEEKAVQFWEKYNKNIVIKANNGTGGNEVFHIRTKQELKDKYEILQQKNYSMSICPFYEINKEYRVIYLQNSIRYMYQKQNAVVIGNGKDTLKELLQKFNSTYFSHSAIENGEKIPRNGEKVVYEWRFNLGKGARIEKIEDSKKEKITLIAKQVAQTIGLQFGSIDIIETKAGEYFVIEVNSGVMTEQLVKQLPEGRKIAYGIYEAAIKKMMCLT